MVRITIDSQLGQQLHGMTETVELCDERGRVIGRFVPQVDINAYAPLTPQVSDEELNRREESSEWFTTAEVLEQLGRT